MIALLSFSLLLFLAFEGLNISLYISVFDKSKRSRLEH